MGLKKSEMQSHKVANDAYYTPKEIAKHCIEKTIEVLGKENIFETVIEPSAGNGSFSLQLEKYNLSCIAIDLHPQHETIIKENFLESETMKNIGYQAKMLFIGNPPFGERNNLARAFYNKCAEYGDYIAFILPISQLDNKQSLFKFDLIFSEDLGVQRYSDRDLHCCFNIYKRPEIGNLKSFNSKPKAKLKDITLCRHDCNNYANFEYDLRICFWGNATAGKILEEGEHYSSEYKIKINNELLKDKIINFFKTINWREEKKSISMQRLSQIDIMEALKKYIPEIQ